jgi:hypothetical protein
VQVTIIKLKNDWEPLKGQFSMVRDVIEMCIMLDVVIPEDFKVPQFDKFTGS